MSDHRPLSEYLPVKLSESRLDKQWAVVEQRLPRARGEVMLRRSLPWGLTFLVSVASAFLWMRQPAGAARLAPIGALLESEREPLDVRLAEGSQVQLSSETRMRVLRNSRASVELDVQSGVARFDVVKRSGRRFVVRAADAEVHVVGTHFEVARRESAVGSEVRVTVTEGVVEVRRTDASAQEQTVRRIGAGETWVVSMPKPAPVLAEPLPQVVSVLPPAHVASDGVNVAVEAPAVDVVDDDVALLVQDDERDEQVTKGLSATVLAAHVFKRATLARRGGRMEDAASAYATLLRKFPRDRRAGLVAFELGRIRMDALGDPAGAVVALRRSIVLAPNASFSEDAVARVVLAYDALGKRPECKSERAKYLAAYPTGLHTGALMRRCGGK